MKRALTVFLVALMIVAVAADAFARAGRGGSFGSRGSRTYDRPMERSVTPPPSQVTPQAPAAQPGVTQPMYKPNALGQSPGMAASQTMARPGFFQRNPMMGGLMAGMLGAGLFGMLFNSSALAGAGEAAPFASFLGMVLQFALIGGLVWLAIRFFRRRAEPVPAGAATQGVGQGGGYARQAYGSVPAAGARVEREYEVAGADFDAFTDVILAVQAAWSAGDLGRLRQSATPEVISWMAEDLARDASQGVRNVVEDVKLVNGDVVESWREDGKEYVTAAITFAARDYTLREDTGEVVEGDRDNPVEVTEAWTFVRAAGGKWLLSAIEKG